MNITWLHISDFHIRGGDPYDRNVVLKALVDSVKKFREKGRAPDLIFATGDIAHGGKQKEYKLATPFFDDLLEAAQLDKQKLFVIPGNHDVDRDQGLGLARTLATREEVDKYFTPKKPKPHLTQKMGAFASWHDKYFKGIRKFPRDSSCGPVECVEVHGRKLGILPINSALFCQDDEDHNKLLIGRRALEAALEQLKTHKADLNIALMHHPLDWLNDVERSNIKKSLYAEIDFILRGHLHETEIEHVASPYGQALVWAAGAAYQTRKWPNRAVYAALNARHVAVFPTRYEDHPREIWTVDPTLFPDEKDHEKNFPIARFNQHSPVPAASEPPESSVLPKFRGNVPARGSLPPLVGREEDLNEILKLFGNPDKESVLVLHGLPGAGKSEVAREFARRQKERYPGGTFILDASNDALALEFARIGRTILNLTFPAGLSLPEQGERTFFSLSHAPVLLIYDNLTSLDSVRKWLPPSGMPCHVLITSINGNGDAGWAFREIKPLSESDSLKLNEQLGGAEVAQRYGKALAKMAAGLPVQICSTALTLGYEQRRGRLDSAELDISPETNNSFHLVYERLEEPVRLLLHGAAFLNHQRIPRDQLALHLLEPLSWSEAQFQEMLDICLDLHLLEGNQELKMHQLFAAFLMTETQEADAVQHLLNIRTVQRAKFLRLAQELSENPARSDTATSFLVFPQNPEAWHIAGAGVSAENGRTVGRALYEIGRFTEARPWFERAVLEIEKGDVHGRVDHASLGVSLHQVGYCLSQTGKYEEGRSWYERAVTEVEKGDVQGRVDHESLGNSLHQVGYCLSQTGKYEEARSWFERAVTEKEKGDVQGRVNHTNLGNSLNQVGYCLSQGGKYEEARSWYERAVAEDEKGDVHGRVDNENLGCSLHWVGYCLWEVRKYQEALSWYERAVLEKEKGDVHGRVDHASLGISLHAVGYCLSQRGNYEEARSWYDRAVAEAEKGDVHGRVDHENLGRSLHRVGYCLSETSKHEEARSWFVRAVIAKKKGNIFGEVAHTSLALSLKAGAACVRALGQEEEASKWDKEAAELEQAGQSG